MALNNPAFDNPAFQDQRAVQTYPGGQNAARLGGPTQSATAQQAATDAAAQARLEGMYASPAAGAIETDRMTVEDTVMKTLGSVRHASRHGSRRLALDDGARHG